MNIEGGYDRRFTLTRVRSLIIWSRNQDPHSALFFGNQYSEWTIVDYHRCGLRFIDSMHISVQQYESLSDREEPSDVKDSD